MQYVFHWDSGDETVMLTAPVEAEYAEYFERVIETMRPLTDEEYMDGPALIPYTPAEMNYILHEKSVYWLVLWEPGLVVVRFSPDGSMAWTGVKTTDEDFADEPFNDMIPGLYELQEDEDLREDYGFEPADEAAKDEWEKAMAKVYSLETSMQRRSSNEREKWFEQCEENMRNWLGDGVEID